MECKETYGCNRYIACYQILRVPGNSLFVLAGCPLVFIVVILDKVMKNVKIFQMLLAGDIGGTKTQLALYDASIEPEKTHEQSFYKSYPSTAFKDFETVFSLFIKDARNALQKDFIIKKGALAVAGPVDKAVCKVTNLSWTLSASQIANQFNITSLILINDLQAIAYAVPFMSEENFVFIQNESLIRGQTMAVIAPGTGLGEAVLHWDGHRYHALASEAGHADFAPLNEIQFEFVEFCRKKDGLLFNQHVGIERVLSGDSIVDLYHFLSQRSEGKRPIKEPDALFKGHAESGWSALISSRALNNEDELCVEVMELYASMLAAEAGNLALRSLAYGGVVIGGGIAPKILPIINSDLFRKNFSAKGRFQNMLEDMPVSICVNVQAPIVGALEWISREK